MSLPPLLSLHTLSLWFLQLVVLVTLEIPSGCSSIGEIRGREANRPGTGSGFQCTTEIKNCIEPVTSKICSGNGACVCGECACFQTDFETYYGRFCEHCETCSPNLCDHLKPCVECKVHLTGPYEKQQDCEAHCSRFPEIQIAQVASSDEKDESYYCTFRDTEGCEFYFVYGYDAAGHLIIIAEKDKECPVQTFVVNQTLSSSPTGTSAATLDKSHGQQQQRLTEFHRMKSSWSPSTSHDGQRTPTSTSAKTQRNRPPPVFTEYRHPNPNPPTDQQKHYKSVSPSTSETDNSKENDKEQITGAEKNGSKPFSPDAETGSTRKTPAPRIPAKKLLNTPAFDLMIVCGLTLTRNSDKTTQQPQYFQRNGIHFHIENCQFIPKYEAFVFTEHESTVEQQQLFEFEKTRQGSSSEDDFNANSNANSISSFIRINSNSNYHYFSFTHIFHYHFLLGIGIWCCWYFQSIGTSI